MCGGAAPRAANGRGGLRCTEERGWKNTPGEQPGRNYGGINADQNFQLAACFSVETIHRGLGETEKVSTAALGTLHVPGWTLLTHQWGCKSATEGEETAVQIPGGLLVPFTLRELMGEWWNDAHVEEIQWQCWAIPRDTKLSSCYVWPESPFGLWSPLGNIFLREGEEGDLIIVALQAMLAFGMNLSNWS